MSTEQNKAIFQRLIDASNTGDPSQLRDVVYDVVAEDCVIHTPGEPDVHGPDGYMESLSLFHEAFPDIQIEILNQIAEDDWVTIHYLFRGTHEQELAGIPPTGRQVTIEAVSLSRVRDGKIVEEHSFVDNMHVFRQLGVEIEPQAGAQGAS